MSKNFTSCICKASIPNHWPYCKENKGCLQFIFENERYLFDNASESAIFTYILGIPIDTHKKLIQKDLDDIQIPQELLESDLTPIDFLLPEITTDFPNNLNKLQRHPKMITFAKEIRKKNFNRHLLISFNLLSEYWALFLYESRNHKIWKIVLNSIIKSTFTPENLLRHLDTIFRQNSIEYLKFYSNLSTNQKLKREIFIIEEDTTGLENKEDQTVSKDLNRLTTYQLNTYSNHWFPGILVAVTSHPNIYKSNLEKIFDDINNWKDNFYPFTHINLGNYYNYDPSNAQQVNPQQNDLIKSIVKHPKASKKILTIAVKTTNPDIRKLVVMSEKCPIGVLKKLQTDDNEIIRKIAQFHFFLYEKQREFLKNIRPFITEQQEESPIIFTPEQLEELLKDTGT